MRRLLPLLLLLAVPAAPRAVTAAHADTHQPGRALVRFDPGTPAAVVLAAHARAGATVVRSIPSLGYQLVAFDPALPIDAVLASYRNDPAVAVAEPNLYARIAADDPCLTGACGGVQGQWSLAMTNATEGWNGEHFTAASKRTLPRITVAVLDTKIDATHPDFVNAGGTSADARDGGQLDLVNARDWIPARDQSGAALYHGTYVAGIVAAATNNAHGVASLGARATILPLTVVDGTGRADAASLAEAIVYAADKGARIINLSLGLTADSQAVHDAIRAVASRTLVVAAAGNNTGSAPFYPGSYPEVMSVAGTSPTDGPASCSNHNANVSVSAPAEKVVGPNFGGGFVAPPCGTSAAAPQASALAALVLAQDSSRTPAQVRSIIERSTDDLGSPGRDNRFGHGRINAGRALRSGAIVTSPRATVPNAAGASTVTGSASTPTGVRAARIFFGSLSATPVALDAADGAFGEPIEQLTATLTIPAGTAPGPHPIYVQAFDGTRWGPSAVGVLLVDGAAPSITSVSATNAVRASGSASVIRYTLGDDTSTTLIVGYQVFNATGNEVFRDARTNVPVGGGAYEWHPASSILPGSYQMKIIAVDQAGRSSATLVGFIVA